MQLTACQHSRVKRVTAANVHGIAMTHHQLQLLVRAPVSSTALLAFGIWHGNRQSGGSHCIHESCYTSAHSVRTTVSAHASAIALAYSSTSVTVSVTMARAAQYTIR
jgi:hypothetical protein